MKNLESYNRGKRGEELALEFLQNQDYALLTKNFRIPGGEIDLIMQKAGTIIFVEVKARSNSHFGTPEESFHYFKKAKLLTVIQTYLLKHQLDVPWRLDLITLQFSARNVFIKHYQDILQND